MRSIILGRGICGWAVAIRRKTVLSNFRIFVVNVFSRHYLSRARRAKSRIRELLRGANVAYASLEDIRSDTLQGGIYKSL